MTRYQHQNVRAHTRRHRGRLIQVRAYDRDTPITWDTRPPAVKTRRARKSIYYEPDSKHRTMPIDTPASARARIRLLKKEYANTHTDAGKLRVERALDAAAKRAEGSAERKNISARDRKEFLEVAGIYNQYLREIRAERSLERFGKTQLSSKRIKKTRADTKSRTITKKLFGDLSESSQKDILVALNNTGEGQTISDVYVSLTMEGKTRAANELARKANWEPPKQRDAAKDWQQQQIEKQKKRSKDYDEVYKKYISKTRSDTEPFSKSRFHQLYVKDLMDIDAIVKQERKKEKPKPKSKDHPSREQIREDAKKRPWEVSRSQYLAITGAPTVGIMLDVSPTQMSRMSKRGKKAYFERQEERHRQRGQSTDQWRKAIIDAYERGEISYEDASDTQRGMNDESPSSVLFSHIRKKERVAEIKAKKEDRLMRKVRDASEIRVGDKVRDMVSRRVGVVTKVNRKTIKMEHPNVEYLKEPTTTKIRFAEWPEGTKRDFIEKRRKQ